MPNSPIKLIVFDWAGTTIDYGCFAPVIAFRAAFESRGIRLTDDEIRGPMGLLKIEHIRTLFGLESVSAQWREQHGRDWSEDDVTAIYEAFLPVQIEKAQECSELIPGVKECFESLKERGILVAATTGYPRAVAAPIIESAAEQGYRPDATVCADEVSQGRPAPWMIYRCMEQLGIFPPSAVLKVGDTVADMRAGVNAGVRSVGVVLSGSEVGLSPEEFAALTPAAQSERIERAKNRLNAAGAHCLVNSVANLPAVLDSIS